MNYSTIDDFYIIFQENDFDRYYIYDIYDNMTYLPKQHLEQRGVDLDNLNNKFNIPNIYIHPKFNIRTFKGIDNIREIIGIDLNEYYEIYDGDTLVCGIVYSKYGYVYNSYRILTDKEFNMVFIETYLCENLEFIDGL